MVVTKEELRREILKRRTDQDPDEKSVRDERIRENLKGLPEFRPTGTILMFYPIKGEPDITPLFDYVLSRGGALVLPKVDGNNLRVVRLLDPTQVQAGRFRVPEPVGGEEVSPEDLDLAIVPGIVFDRRCYRIGFGKGFYDRLLAKVPAPKVGVGYSFQVVPEVPRDPWDVPLDLVVTDEEVIRR